MCALNRRAYLASLTAAGSALVLASLTKLDRDTRRMVGRLGLGCAFTAGLASAALIAVGAIYLAGGSWAGAADPGLTGMVTASPVGESLGVRIAGLAVVAVLFISGKAPRIVAVAGAGIVCASFAFRGHVLAEPRVILGALVRGRSCSPGPGGLVATLLDPQGRSGTLIQCHRISLCGHRCSSPPPYTNSMGCCCLSHVGREGFLVREPPDGSVPELHPFIGAVSTIEVRSVGCEHRNGELPVGDRTMFLRACRVAAQALIAALVIALPTMADYEAGQRALDAGDPGEALTQWRAAAGADDRRAMLALGRLYMQGLGVLQDYVEAHKWLNLAAGRGEATAAQERNALAEKMTPQQVATAQKRASEWRPAADETVKASDTDVATASVSDTGPPRQTIHEAQVLLAELGYEPGAFDGVWNSGSARAYGEFLRDAGLPSGETLTPEALRVMRETARRERGEILPSPTQTLHREVALNDTDTLVNVMDTGPPLHLRCEEFKGTYLLEEYAQCWEKIADRPGCYRWDEHFHSDRTTQSWSGRCSGGLADGSGTLSVASGSDHPAMEASGSHMNGKAEGQWVERYADGAVLEGPYLNGLRHGHWIERYADGSVFKGRYVYGVAHGQWSERSASGRCNTYQYSWGDLVDELQQSDSAC